MFRAFSWSAAIAAFALAVLGSWIRINGAGMTCPDWPLCHGQIIPPLDGGVLLEWSHRMVAFFEGFLVLGALITGWRERNRIAFIRPVVGFIAAVFVMQVALGAATVALANNPPSVVWHWAVAMLFLAGLSALAILAALEPLPGAPPARQSGLYPVLGACAVSAFGAMCAGAYVSSSGAGLACLSFPSCGDGGWLGASAPQFAQMLHRAFAGVFVVFATVAAYWAATGARGRVRAAVLTGFGLILVQIALGIGNVLWALPVPLREMHAANAGLTFLAFVTAVVLATLDGTAPQPSTARRRTVNAAAAPAPAAPATSRL
jgi:heme A synthase